MRRRRLKRLAMASLLVAAALLLRLPSILKAMPSRYVARLPESVQELGARGDGAATLPTVAAQAEATALLQTLPLPTVTPVVELPTLPPPILDVDIVTPDTPTPLPTTSPTRIPILPAAVRLEGFRHQFQTWNNCGPATIAMALSYFDLYLDQSETAAFLKPDPEDRNVSPYQMVAYVNEKTPFAAIDRTNGTLETVKRLVAAGFPTIIELGIEPPGEYRWLGWYGHYLLIVAYDNVLEQFWVYDSWFGTSEVPMENATTDGRILHYADAEKQWRQFNRNYIALYRPEDMEQVAAIVGEDLDDTIMWQKSLARIQGELVKEPKDAFLWFNLGTAYNALGEYEEGATAFDQARAIGLPWRVLWYQFGLYRAYFEVGRYNEVIALADVTLQDRPYFEESYYFRGLALAAKGETKAARADFEKAVAFNPNYPPPVSALSELDG